MPRIDKDTLSRFKTFSLADNAKRNKKSKTTEPGASAVKEAKDWVDHNKK